MMKHLTFAARWGIVSLGVILSTQTVYAKMDYTSTEQEIVDWAKDREKDLNRFHKTVKNAGLAEKCKVLRKVCFNLGIIKSELWSQYDKIKDAEQKNVDSLYGRIVLAINWGIHINDVCTGPGIDRSTLPVEGVPDFAEHYGKAKEADLDDLEQAINNVTFQLTQIKNNHSK